MKKILRSKTDRKLMGVCGGIADYLDVDPTIIRLIFIGAIPFGGTGLWAYLICMFVIPEEN